MGLTIAKLSTPRERDPPADLALHDRARRGGAPGALPDERAGDRRRDRHRRHRVGRPLDRDRRGLRCHDPARGVAGRLRHAAQHRHRRRHRRLDPGARRGRGADRRRPSQGSPARRGDRGLLPARGQLHRRGAGRRERGQLRLPPLPQPPRLPLRRRPARADHGQGRPGRRRLHPLRGHRDPPLRLPRAHQPGQGEDRPQHGDRDGGGGAQAHRLVHPLQRRRGVPAHRRPRDRARLLPALVQRARLAEGLLRLPAPAQHRRLAALAGALGRGPRRPLGRPPGLPGLHRPALPAGPDPHRPARVPRGRQELPPRDRARRPRRRALPGTGRDGVVLLLARSRPALRDDGRHARGRPLPAQRHPRRQRLLRRPRAAPHAPAAAQRPPPRGAGVPGPDHRNVTPRRVAAGAGPGAPRGGPPRALARRPHRGTRAQPRRFRRSASRWPTP